MCNIITTMPYNGCSQMVSISLKTKKSFIAHPWCLLSVVGLEEYSAHDWRAVTSVQRAPVTWREWGMWWGVQVLLTWRPLVSLWRPLVSYVAVLYFHWKSLKAQNYWHLTVRERRPVCPDTTGCFCRTTTRGVQLARQGCWCCACRSGSPELHESYCWIPSIWCFCIMNSTSCGLIWLLLLLRGLLKFCCCCCCYCGCRCC